MQFIDSAQLEKLAQPLAKSGYGEHVETLQWVSSADSGQDKNQD